MSIHIRFEVTPGGEPGEAPIGHARFENRGAAAVPLLAMQVQSASLALEIRDEAGEPVPLPPPPVPRPSAVPIELDPGESMEADYPGFIPAWTPPGRYRVRARLGDAASEWVEVAVAG